ncbi:MAG: hypothetical protein U1E83_00890 [Methylotetracoccus sp.]
MLHANPPPSLGAAIAAYAFAMNRLVADKLADGDHELRALLDRGYRLLFTFAPEPASDCMQGRVSATVFDPQTGDAVTLFELELIEQARGEPPNTAPH